jgi:hypothetical protein
MRGLDRNAFTRFVCSFFAVVFVDIAIKAICAHTSNSIFPLGPDVAPPLLLTLA